MKNYKAFRHTIFVRILRASLFCLVAAGTVAAVQADFIETYDDGTDVGLWHCSVAAPRTLEADGGNPGAYIQQGGFSTAIPTWASVSTRFQPGVSDPYKIDSIYTGDWASLGVALGVALGVGVTVGVPVGVALGVGVGVGPV